MKEIFKKMFFFLTFRASVSSFRMALVSLFPFSARVSRCGRAASVGRSWRKASSVSSVKPSSKLTKADEWCWSCAFRRSMSRVVSGIPDRSNAPLDNGADSTAFKLRKYQSTLVWEFTVLNYQNIWYLSCNNTYTVCNTSRHLRQF